MGSREAVAMVKIDLITGFLGAGKTTFLKKYADFAMYQVKKSTKGNLAEFDKALYEDEKLNRQMRLEFHQLIEKEQLTYHF